MKDPEKVIREVLEDYFWPKNLKHHVAYYSESDDAQRGSGEGISVMATPDADFWLRSTMGPCQSYRCRTGIGGGRNRRTRNALMILAMAIELDESDPL
jgi:hypothetical protein